MDTLPEKYLLQYIVKKKKKETPTWQDVNELKHAAAKSEELRLAGVESDIFDKTLERIRYSREKIGVMISFINPEYPNLIAIGYSLVNRPAGDKFDYQVTRLGEIGPVGYFEAEGFGKHIAAGRAEAWSTPELYAKMNYRVPASIKPLFKAFAERSQRYYKDKELPQWVYVTVF